SVPGSIANLYPSGQRAKLWSGRSGPAAAVMPGAAHLCTCARIGTCSDNCPSSTSSIEGIGQPHLDPPAPEWTRHRCGSALVFILAFFEASVRGHVVPSRRVVGG